MSSKTVTVLGVFLVGLQGAQAGLNLSGQSNIAVYWGTVSQGLPMHCLCANNVEIYRPELLWPEQWEPGSTTSVLLLPKYGYDAAFQLHSNA